MKFKCKICGQQIDNPYICPYCGSGSDHIILIDEDEEKELKEEVTEEKLDETYEDESSYETNSNEENEDQEIDDNSSNISNNGVEETSNENLNDSKLEEEDNRTLLENEQKVLDLKEKPAEFEYFLKIYGYLYLNNLELASKFKKYFDHYLLEKSLEAAKDFTEEDFKNFTSKNDFLNKIMEQFKL